MEVFEHEIHWCPTFVLSNNFQKWSNGLKTHTWEKYQAWPVIHAGSIALYTAAAVWRQKKSVIKLKQRHSNHFLFTAASMCALSQRPGSQCANVHTDVHLIRSTLSVWSQPECLNLNFKKFSKWIYLKNILVIHYFSSPFLLFFCKLFRSGTHTECIKNNFPATVQIKDSQCTASYAILDFPVIFTPFGL